MSELHVLPDEIYLHWSLRGAEHWRAHVADVGTVSAAWTVNVLAVATFAAAEIEAATGNRLCHECLAQAVRGFLDGFLVAPLGELSRQTVSGRRGRRPLPLPSPEYRAGILDHGPGVDPGEATHVH